MIKTFILSYFLLYNSLVVVVHCYQNFVMTRASEIANYYYPTDKEENLMNGFADEVMVDKANYSVHTKMIDKEAACLNYCQQVEEKLEERRLKSHLFEQPPKIAVDLHYSVVHTIGL